jgi:hypothetical protein
VVVRAEEVAATVRRALGAIHKMVTQAGRRQAAAPGAAQTLNDTTLDFLQDMLEATQRGNATFALAKAEFRLEAVLQANGLQAVPYGPSTASFFDVDGDPARARTQRPALLNEGRCLKRGLAAEPPA